MQHRAQALPSPSLVTSPFLPQVFLMVFVVYFVVSESLSIKKEGRAYFTLWGNYGQWVFILLSTCTVVVHLSQATLADQQWLKYLNNRKGFTNFYQVAILNTVFSTLAASLLFLLTVQVWRGLSGCSTGTGMSFARLWCSSASSSALGSPSAGLCSKTKHRSVVLLRRRWWNVLELLLHPDPAAGRGGGSVAAHSQAALLCLSLLAGVERAGRVWQQPLPGAAVVTPSSLSVPGCPTAAVRQAMVCLWEDLSEVGKGAGRRGAGVRRAPPGLRTAWLPGEYLQGPCCPSFLNHAMTVTSSLCREPCLPQAGWLWAGAVSVICPCHRPFLGCSSGLMLCRME